MFTATSEFGFTPRFIERSASVPQAEGVIQQAHVQPAHVQAVHVQEAHGSAAHGQAAHGQAPPFKGKSTIVSIKL